MPARKETARKCLLEAGAILKKHFRKISYSLKGHANLLTKADLESQKKILSIITAAHPEDDYLAEENSKKITGAEYIWVIDPLDGTTNYAHGFPAACVSVAAVKNGRTGTGGVYDPFRDELFLAERGKGATLNGKKIHVSKAARLADSLLLTGFPYDRNKFGEFYCGFYIDFIKISHDARRSGSAALDLSWTAAGRVDGYWEFKLNPWDVAAGALLVEEAGGTVTNFEGKKWTSVQDFGKQTLASNGAIHPEMMAIIRKRLKSMPKGFQDTAHSL